jgi:hypothetical protein
MADEPEQYEDELDEDLEVQDEDAESIKGGKHKHGGKTTLGHPGLGDPPTS